MGEIEPDHTLDVRGEVCPMPALKTKLEVLTSDSASQMDIPALAKRSWNI